MLSSRDKEMLLWPGWAGDLSRDEEDHIIRKLRASPHMRERWGLTDKKITRSAVRRIARDGVGDQQKRLETGQN